MVSVQCQLRELSINKQTVVGSMCNNRQFVDPFNSIQASSKRNASRDSAKGRAALLPLTSSSNVVVFTLCCGSAVFTNSNTYCLLERSERVTWMVPATSPAPRHHRHLSTKPLKRRFLVDGFCSSYTILFGVRNYVAQDKGSLKQKRCTNLKVCPEASGS